MKKYLLSVVTALAILAGCAPAFAGPSSGIVQSLFVQKGAGAVSRGYGDKIAEQVSVNDFAGVDPTGATDSSAGIQLALNSGAKKVLFPETGSYMLKSYVQPKAGQTLQMYGKIILTTKAATSTPSGIDVDSVQGVIIDGGGTGVMTDPGVVAAYVWNQEYKYAPAIHVRRSTDVTVKGLKITYVVQGILVSAQSSAWYTSSAGVQNGTVFAKNVTVQDCNITYTQVIGIGASQTRNLNILNNYVYRSGDSGIFVMDSVGVKVIGNTRESPYGDGTVSDLTDGQGLSLENVATGVVRDNKITGLSITGIDIKRGSDNILVTGNTIRDVQDAPIAIRGGDMSNTANNHITVENNTIIRLGYPHTSATPYALPTYSITGGIYAGAVKQITIRNNVITGYQTVPAIKCNLAIGDFDFYHTAKNEAYCVIEGNRISFVADTGAELNYNMTANQPDAIYVSGVYDTVSVENNIIQGNRINLADTRTGNGSGINIVGDVTDYGSGIKFFPKILSVQRNKVNNFGGFGVRVEGADATFNTFAGSHVISGNQVANAGNAGMRLIYLKSPSVSGNSVISGGSTGAPKDSITISGCNGIIFTGNIMEKRTNPDADLGGNALSLLYTSPALNMGNRINGPTDYTGSTVTTLNNL